MDSRGMTKNRKRGRVCSMCRGSIGLWAMYRSSSKRSVCESCFISPPVVQRGVLNEDSEGLQQCHVCYMYYAFLGSHLSSHGYTADEYKEEFGLSRLTPLMGRDRREKQAEVAKDNQSKGFFPDGEFGKKLLDQYRKNGSRSILAPRLQERLKRSERFLTDENPMKNPEIRERHLQSIRRRKKV